MFMLNAESKNNSVLAAIVGLIHGHLRGFLTAAKASETLSQYAK